MKLKTSEFASASGLSACTVREYSNAGLLSPIEVSEVGYRSFDPRQISSAFVIKALRDSGLGLADIAGSRSPEQLLRTYRANALKTEQEIAELRARLSVWQSHAMLLSEGLRAKPGEISTQDLPTLRMQLGRPVLYGQKRKKRAQNDENRAGLLRDGNPGCPTGEYYTTFFDFLERPESPERYFSLDPQGVDVREAGLYLVGADTCFYGQKCDLAQRMFQYSLENGYEFIGPAYTIYLFDDSSGVQPDQFLMQTVAMVHKEHENVNN